MCVWVLISVFQLIARGEVAVWLCSGPLALIAPSQATLLTLLMWRLVTTTLPIGGSRSFTVFVALICGAIVEFLCEQWLLALIFSGA